MAQVQELVQDTVEVLDIVQVLEQDMALVVVQVHVLDMVDRPELEQDMVVGLVHELQLDMVLVVVQAL